MQAQPIIKRIVEHHGGFPKGVYPVTGFYSRYGYKTPEAIKLSGTRNYDDGLRTAITPKCLYRPALDSAFAIRVGVNAGKWEQLESSYLAETNSFRLVLAHALGEKDAAVVIEESGTSALAVIYGLVGLRDGDNVLTTRASTILSPELSKGKILYSMDSTFLSLPNCGFFSKPTKFEERTLNVGTIFIETYSPPNPVPDSKIINSVEHGIRNPSVKLLLFPSVSREGRMMPICEVAEVVRDENIRREKAGLGRVWFVLDSVQAIGKTDSEFLNRPLSLCDFMFISSCKGLGGLPISSAFLAKKETIESLLPNLEAPPFSNYLKHFSFPGEFAERLAKVAERNMTAVSLPELVSFKASIKGFFGSNAAMPDDSFLSLGPGQLSQNARVKLSYPSALASEMQSGLLALSKTHAIKLFQNEGDTKFCPTSLSFYIESPGSYFVRDKLIKKDRTITGFVQFDENKKPCDSDGVIRMAFPAYREPPLPAPLISKLEEYVTKR